MEPAEFTCQAIRVAVFSSNRNPLRSYLSQTHTPFVWDLQPPKWQTFLLLIQAAIFTVSNVQRKWQNVSSLYGRDKLSRSSIGITATKRFTHTLVHLHVLCISILRRLFSVFSASRLIHCPSFWFVFCLIITLPAHVNEKEYSWLVFHVHMLK